MLQPTTPTVIFT